MRWMGKIIIQWICSWFVFGKGGGPNLLLSVKILTVVTLVLTFGGFPIWEATLSRSPVYKGGHRSTIHYHTVFKTCKEINYLFLRRKINLDLCSFCPKQKFGCETSSEQILTGFDWLRCACRVCKLRVSQTRLVVRYYNNLKFWTFF